MKYDVGFASEGGFSYTEIVLDVNQGDEVRNLLLWLVVGSTILLCNKYLRTHSRKYNIKKIYRAFSCFEILLKDKMAKKQEIKWGRQ